MAGTISVDSAMPGAARRVHDGADSWQQQQQQQLQLSSSSAQGSWQMQQLQREPPGAGGCGRVGSFGRPRDQTLFQRVLQSLFRVPWSC